MKNQSAPSSSPSVRYALRSVALLLLGSAAACAPAMARTAQTAAAREAVVERARCGMADDEKSLDPVLRGEAVQSVEALYGDGAQRGPSSEVRGVSITVSALPGMTAESLGRDLQCHSAKAMLGDSHAAWDDPFDLPGSFVAIDVRAAGYGFEVAVAGSSSDEGYAILTRAQAFTKEMARTQAPRTASR
jgi:hypothetical protein